MNFHHLKGRGKRGVKRFYGTTTVGEKGQIVMPIKARKDLRLGKGEQLLVFGMGEDMVAFVKLEQVQKIASHLSENLKMIDQVLKKTKQK
jgi:AbrB family looped-hinge helix DNA binding protein